MNRMLRLVKKEDMCILRTPEGLLAGTINRVSSVNPLPDDKILDWSKLKQFADDILRFI